MSPIQSSRAARIANRFAQDFPDSDAISKEIMARLVQLVGLFEHENQPIFEVYDLNRGMFSALVALRLSSTGQLRHRELLDRILLTSGGVTNLCKRLEQIGLVTKAPDPDDKRGVIFELTASGQEIADDLLPMQHKLERKLLNPLTDDERKLFNGYLERLMAQYDLT